MTTSQRPSTNLRWLTLLLLAYIALAVYGSLYPLSDWAPAQHGLWTALLLSINGYHSRADMVVNLLVYMPLGLLLVLRLQGRGRPATAIVVAAAAGFLLSLMMEYVQLYLPARTTSLTDLLLNALGTVLGAALPLALSDRFPIGRRLHRFRKHWVETGPVASLGLLVIGVWALSQLTPFVPSLDIGNLRAGLSPLYRTLIDPLSFDVAKALSYMLVLTAVGLLCILLLRSHRVQRWQIAAVLLAAVLLLKVPVMARSLSAEAAVGLAVAVLAVRILEHVEQRQLTVVTAFGLVGAYSIEQLRPIAGVVGAMHWPLFSMQMLNIHGLQDILAGLWPFMGLAYLACRAGLPGTPAVIGSGAAAVATLTAGLEWAQLYIPGRYPDATDVVLAVAGWSLPWLYPALKNHNRPVTFR